MLLSALFIVVGWVVLPLLLTVCGLASWRIFRTKVQFKDMHLNLPLNCYTKHSTRHYAKRCYCLVFCRPCFQTIPYWVSVFIFWRVEKFLKPILSLFGLCGFGNVLAN